MTETKEQKRLRKGWSKAVEPVVQPLQQSVVSESTLNKVTVVCVRFGPRYGREYVERLRNMISRHMTVPYEFVCLTDDQHPIEGVRSIVQPNANYARGWWHKVHMFDPALPLSGRILYFDLDIVIHNNIDKLVKERTNEFLGIHDFNRKFYANWNSLNSSAMCWNHGTQNFIWERFKADPKAAMKLPGDQDWIWKLARDRIKFWPKTWIQSYKWEIRSREELTVLNGKRQFKTTQNSIEPPKDCCVTVFHGDPKPQDVKDKFVVDNWR
jgi:hypothetical protein